MNITHLKVRAREVLEYSNNSAVAVSVIALAIKSLCIVCCGFCIFVIVKLRGIEEFSLMNTRTASYYLLFSMGAVISFCFHTLASFSQRRWYRLNAKKAIRVRQFFVIQSIGVQFKVVFIRLLKIVLRMGIGIFYLLPFVASLFITLDLLSGKGIEETVFFLLVLLICSTFVMGLYFTFAAMQRFVFCEEIIMKYPHLSVVGVINKSCELTRGRCFAVAKMKLSFVLWFMVCGFIIPLIFVVPYYRQTFAFASKKAIDKNSLSPEEKPFIIMSLSPEAI